MINRVANSVRLILFLVEKTGLQVTGFFNGFLRGF